MKPAMISRAAPRLVTSIWRYRRAVRAALLNLGIAGPALDDLTQMVFLLAVKRGITPSKAWLVETARKSAANYRCLHRHFRERLDLDTVMEAPASPHGDAELRARINRAFLELSPADQELIVRRFLHGETLVELESVLRLKKSRIAVRVENARKRFIEGFV